MKVLLDLNADEEINSVSANAKYKVTSKGILVSPIVKTMFEAFVKARTEYFASVAALKSKKERKARLVQQRKTAKTPASKESLRKRGSALAAELVEDRKKVAHLKSAMGDARKNAGITFALINKPGKPVARCPVTKRALKIKFATQKNFDKAVALVKGKKK